MIEPIYSKELLSRTSIHQSRKENPREIWAEDLNKEFTEKEMQMTLKHMKRCLDSLIFKEIQMKTILK